MQLRNIKNIAQLTLGLGLATVAVESQATLIFHVDDSYSYQLRDVTARAKTFRLNHSARPQFFGTYFNIASLTSGGRFAVRSSYVPTVAKRKHPSVGATRNNSLFRPTFLANRGSSIGRLPASLQRQLLSGLNFASSNSLLGARWLGNLNIAKSEITGAVTPAQTMVPAIKPGMPTNTPVGPTQPATPTQPIAVAEPSSLALLGLALIGLFGRRIQKSV